VTFHDGLARFGETAALITDAGEVISYARLDREVETVAGRLQDRDVVLVAGANAHPSLVGYLGALRSGAVPLMVDIGGDPSYCTGLIEAYAPDGCWVPEAWAADGVVAGEVVHRFGGWVLLRVEASDTGPDREVHPELALLLATSGSTGSPKYVRLSRRNLESNTRAIAAYLGIAAGDRPITTLPLAYSFGLSILNSHLLRGATILLTQHGILKSEFWQRVREDEATTFGGVPYTYEMLKRLRFFRMDLPSLRYLTQAGGKLPAELSRDFARGCRDRGTDFVVMYGQTEASPRMAYLPPDRVEEKAGSIGIPIPGGEIWLEDDEGRIIEEPGVTGELVYRGDNVCMGYATGRRDLAAGDENGGVLHTGDLATVDRDGFYTVVGRRKRFLKLFGNRVNLSDVEQLLRSAGFDCACSGRDDRLIVFVTGEGEERDILRLLARRAGIPPAGVAVEPVPEIPRNRVGKVLYRKLVGARE